MLWLLCGAVSLLPLLGATARAQEYPEAVVSAFCERDGRGDRLRTGRWGNIAPLVAWRLEPGWDKVYLISGYEVGGVTTTENDIVVRVKYSVVAQVSAAGSVQSEHQDVVEMHLVGEPGAWRIAAPPPWPHLFDSMVDRRSMVASLQPEGGSFVSNSTFVWQMFHGAGWSLSYRPVERYLAEPGLAPVAQPQSGDVVAYLEGGVPYHAGLYQGDGKLISATVNAGTVRTGLDAFAGEVRYLRLSEVERLAPTPSGSPSPAEVDSPAVSPSAPPMRTRGAAAK